MTDREMHPRKTLVELRSEEVDNGGLSWWEFSEKFLG
jgi:hypothetical protein